MSRIRSRKANPASPSIIDLTVTPAPYTLEEQRHADAVLRGIEVQVFIGKKTDDQIVDDARERLRGKTLVMP